MGIFSSTGTIKLGDRYRDSITGYEGTATCRLEYQYGCVRVVLEKADKDGKPEEAIFDEQRLVASDDKPVVPTATSGGARPNHATRSDPR